MEAKVLKRVVVEVEVQVVVCVIVALEARLERRSVGRRRSFVFVGERILGAGKGVRRGYVEGDGWFVAELGFAMRRGDLSDG